jgi:hypothetical protein
MQCKTMTNEPVAERFLKQTSANNSSVLVTAASECTLQWQSLQNVRDVY